MSKVLSIAIATVIGILIVCATAAPAAQPRNSYKGCYFLGMASEEECKLGDTFMWQ